MKQERSVTILSKIESFFEKNYALVFTAVLLLMTYLVALFNYKAWPFSDKYTLASYDLSAQICPFIEHLFDVIQGESSLFYTYAIVGGTDIVGTYLYFFISPFSLLFLIAGDGMVAQSASIVLGLKLITIGTVGTWFAKRCFQGIPDYVCILIGCCYAYTGYTFVSCTYTNWMDFLIYMPLTVKAFIHFIKTDKFLPFALLLACCIYTCFSIACFSMFTVFPILLFYGLICVEKNKRNHYVTRLCLAFLTALLISLPVLTPALFAYLRSARTGDEGLFFNFWHGFTTTGENAFQSFDKEAYLDVWSKALYRKWSYVLSEGFFIVFTLIWFKRKGLKDQFAKFMLLAGVLTLIPVIVDEAMLLLNMGSYMSYALRFGFLNAIYFLSGACLGLEGLCYHPALAYDGGHLLGKKNQPITTCKVSEKADATDEETENEVSKYALSENTASFSIPKNASVWTWIFIAVGVVAVGFLLWFITNGNYMKIWESITSNEETLKNFKSVSARFAHSLGGLEVIAVLFGVVSIVSLLGSILLFCKKISVKLLTYVLVLVVGIQTLFYSNQFVLGNRSTQHTGMASYTALCQTLNQADNSHFRVKDYDDKWTATAPFTGGSHSFSVFSSMIDRDNFIIYNLFGYKGNGKNSLKSAQVSTTVYNNSEFADSFLGYKYYFVSQGNKTSVENKPTNKKFLEKYYVEKDGNLTHLSAGEGDDAFYVYENTMVFPMAYRVDNGAFRFVKENSDTLTDRAENHRALYKFLRGKDLLTQTGGTFISVDATKELSNYLWSKSAKVEVGAGRIDATVTAEKENEYLFLNFVASKGYTAYVNGKAVNLVDNDLKFLCVKLEKGGNVVEFVYHSPYVNYALYGTLGAIVGLCVVALIQRKTKLFEKMEGAISVLGIALAVGLVAFFFLFPSVTWLVKVIKLLL